ncbi:hypothetical protein BDR26DRAFT_922519 [Obelidium mucronatum]|nr:hypothetical protein BDR26DRAFT_922519 [Obelidium mucronatum]
MQNDNIIKIASLKDALTAVCWKRELPQLLASKKLDHCFDPNYLSAQHPRLTNAGANNANNPAVATTADPLHLNLAVLPNGHVYRLVPDNDDANNMFPGNYRQNQAALLILAQTVAPNLKPIINQASNSAFSEFHRLLQRTNIVTDAIAKKLVKDNTNFKQLATESISDLFDRYRAHFAPIAANPTNVHFAPLIPFERQRSIISDALVASFHNQRPRINDAEIDTMDALQNLIEDIANQIEYKPHDAIANASFTEDSKPSTPKRSPSAAGKKQGATYNPLATPRNPVPSTYMLSQGPTYKAFAASNPKTAGKTQRPNSAPNGKAKQDTTISGLLKALAQASKNKDQSAKLKAAFANFTASNLDAMETEEEDDNSDGQGF